MYLIFFFSLPALALWLLPSPSPFVFALAALMSSHRRRMRWRRQSASSTSRPRQPSWSGRGGFLILELGLVAARQIRWPRGSLLPDPAAASLPPPRCGFLELGCQPQQRHDVLHLPLLTRATTAGASSPSRRRRRRHRLPPGVGSRAWQVGAHGFFFAWCQYLAWYRC